MSNHLQIERAEDIWDNLDKHWVQDKKTGEYIHYVKYNGVFKALINGKMTALKVDK